jgi:CheY-like chemotaxis protein
MTNRLLPLVLAADAEPAVLKLIQTALQNESFEVLTAAQGREALRALREGHGLTAAVLAVDLPVFDGLSLLRRIKADAGLAHIAVVMTMSAGKDHHVRAECFAEGAAACLPKPFTEAQLVSVVRLAASGRQPPRPVPARPGADASLPTLYAVIQQGAGAPTCHTLAASNTTTCGRKVTGGRGTDFTTARPPGTKACPFCHR